MNKIELAVRPDSDQRGMTASGMVVIGLLQSLYAT
ncbi:conserved hypothetical protein [Haemophilus influenzae HK1212]|uniref:Uncharacterized protein n=1 Tax=Haemophilus influenzae HK1212 TaxID=456482 RepID=A0A7G2JZA1_HAEIF|nr:conserved hypothetical protein [Haemophilus influenzae HK1212]